MAERTTKKQLETTLENVNNNLEITGKDLRIKLGYAYGKTFIYESNVKGGTVRTIRGMLTKNEAYNILYSIDSILWALGLEDK